MPSTRRTRSGISSRTGMASVTRTAPVGVVKIVSSTRLWPR